MLTAEQLARVRKALANASTALAVETAGPDTVPDEELQRLIDEGWLPPEWAGEDVPRALVDLAYGHGAQSVRDPRVEQAPLSVFTKVVPDPLSALEARARDLAKQRAGQYCVGLGSRWGDRAQLVLGDFDRDLADRTRKIIRDETATAIEERKTTGQLATKLGQLTKDWSRDWKRIANTEVQAAHQEAWAEAQVAMRGEGVMACKVPDPGACDVCRRLYLGPDGRPIVRPMSWWLGQGSNVGKKASAWGPTIAPVHPWCRCQFVRVPAGMEIAEDGSLEVIKSDSGEKLHGGKGDNKPDDDFDAADLAEGIKVEREHTDDPQVAKEIAKDHLSEFPDYYKRLGRMERRMKRMKERLGKAEGRPKLTLRKGGGADMYLAPDRSIPSGSWGVHRDEAKKLKRLQGEVRGARHVLDATGVMESIEEAAKLVQLAKRPRLILDLRAVAGEKSRSSPPPMPVESELWRQNQGDLRPNVEHNREIADREVQRVVEDSKAVIDTLWSDVRKWCGGQQPEGDEE